MDGSPQSKPAVEPTSVTTTTWREAVGRASGRDGYTFGDVTRGALNRIFGPRSPASPEQCANIFVMSDSSLPGTSIAYKDVPLPSNAEVETLLSDIPSLERRLALGPIDATALVDLSMRFACLAYRRNAPTARNALVLRDEYGEPYAIELQFRAAQGAHAVVYLIRTQAGSSLCAVICFKGSTLSSPGAPLLSDWAANLRMALPWGGKDAASGTPFLNDSPAAASVHPGWYAYLQELIASFKLYQLDCLPDGLSVEWSLAGDLWNLLRSKTCEQALLVGNSIPLLSRMRQLTSQSFPVMAGTPCGKLHPVSLPNAAAHLPIVPRYGRHSLWGTRWEVHSPP